MSRRLVAEKLHSRIHVHRDSSRGATPDRLGRFRDRAVIEFMHTLRKESGLYPYDSVRAAFPEGPRRIPPWLGIRSRRS